MYSYFNIICYYSNLKNCLFSSISSNNFHLYFVSPVLVFLSNNLAIPEDEIDFYCEMLKKFIQMDRGISIPGAPVGCDFEIGDDYSMGKFEKQYL